MVCSYHVLYNIIMIGFRNAQIDPTPGNLFSCMSFVERTLPIALARPFVEQFVPGGTKVSILDLS